MPSVRGVERDLDERVGREAHVDLRRLGDDRRAQRVQELLVVADAVAVGVVEDGRGREGARVRRAVGLAYELELAAVEEARVGEHAPVREEAARVAVGVDARRARAPARHLLGVVEPVHVRVAHGRIGLGGALLAVEQPIAVSVRDRRIGVDLVDEDRLVELGVGAGAVDRDVPAALLLGEREAVDVVVGDGGGRRRGERHDEDERAHGQLPRRAMVPWLSLASHASIVAGRRPERISRS